MDTATDADTVMAIAAALATATGAESASHVADTQPAAFVKAMQVLPAVDLAAALGSAAAAADSVVAAVAASMAAAAVAMAAADTGKPARSGKVNRG